MASESKSRRASAKASGAGARRAQPPTHRPRGLLAGDPERSARILLIGGTALIVAIAVGFIAFGYYWSVVKPRHRTVLKVDSYEVSLQAMRRRMEYEYFSRVAYQQSPGVLPSVAYAALVKELTLVSRAEPSLGITPTAEEIEAKLRTRVGATPDADDQTFAQRYSDALSVSGLTDSEYRRLSLGELLDEKAREKFKAEAPASAPQARIEVIATNDEETARLAADRVRAGEDWATVAKELSIAPDAQTTGGAAGPSPEGFFDPTYNSYAFTAPIGEVSPPLESSSQAAVAGAAPRFFVVRVVDRQELPLEDLQKGQFATKAYEQWLADTGTEVTLIDKWTTDTDAQVDAVLDITEGAPARQEPVRDAPPVAIQTTVAVATVAAPAPAEAPPPTDGQ